MVKITHSKNQTWYAFFFDLIDCDQASILRSFMAPIYIPYINVQEKATATVILQQQKECIEQCTKIINSYSSTEIRKKSAPENSEYEVKKRLKNLGNYLSDNIQNDCAFNYLGKNRNIENYPERFVYSILPNHGEGVFYELQDYFTVIVKYLYNSDSVLLDEALDRLESLNQQTDFFHARPFVALSSDEYFNKIDRICYLLCAFSLLSSAHQVQAIRKNGLLFDKKDDIFQKAQNLLEINPEHYPVLHPNDLSIEFNDFVQLCSSIVNRERLLELTTIRNICEHNQQIFIKDERNTHIVEDLIKAIGHDKHMLLVDSALPSQDENKVNTTIQELSLLVDIEKYLKQYIKC